MKKVCVYAICKNEIKFVERWFNTIKNADYICVLDTGSTDGTFERLKELESQFPNYMKVEQKEIKPWRFDVARNESMKLIPEDTDICVSIDFDDVFPKDWKEIIIEDIEKGYNKIIGKYQYFDGDEPKDTTNLDRISLYGEAHWENGIHERLVCKNENAISDDRFLVEHRQDLTKERRSVYLEAAKSSYSEDDYYSVLCLGYECYNVGDYQTSINLFTKLYDKLKDTNSEFLTRKWLLVLAEMYKYLGNEECQITWLERAVKINNPKSSFEDTFNYDGSIEDQLALWYYYHEGYLKALKYGYEAHKINPSDERLKTNLEFYKTANDVTTEEEIEKLIYKRNWVLLLTNDIYIYGVITTVKALKRTNTKYPISIVITPNLSEATLNILRDLGLNIIVKETIKPKDDSIAVSVTELIGLDQPGYHAALTKFEMYNLTQFDKIVYTDTDVWIRDNVDELFEYPNGSAMQDVNGALQNFCSGLLVIEPNKKTYDDLMNFFYNDYKSRDNLIHDQDVLQQFFKDWINHPELIIPNTYGIWSSRYEPEKDYNCKIVHMIDKKPWVVGDNYFRDLYDRFPNYCQVTLDYIDVLNEDIEEYKLPKIQDGIVDKFNEYLNKHFPVVVYTICKNEIKNLDNWIKPLLKADKIFVLDTGSADGTWERLKELSKEHNNVYVRRKCYDTFKFDVARNDSLDFLMEYIHNGVALFLDLDEIYSDNIIDEVKNQWNTDYDILSIYCQNADMWSMKGHRIDKSMRWHYHIHEKIVKNHFENTTFLNIENAYYNHYQDLSKDRSYYEKLKKTNEEEPNCIHYLTYLIWEAQLHNEPNKVEEYAFKTAIEINENINDEHYHDYQYLVYCLLNLDDEKYKDFKSEHIKHIETAIINEEYPDYKFVHMFKYQVDEKNKDYENAEAELLMILNAKETGTWIDGNFKLDDHNVYVLLMMNAYYNLKNYAKAYYYSKILYENYNEKTNYDICREKYLEELRNEK